MAEHDYDDPFADVDVTVNVAYHALLVAGEDCTAAELSLSELPPPADLITASASKSAHALVERMRDVLKLVSSAFDATIAADTAKDRTEGSKCATETVNHATDVRALLSEVRKIVAGTQPAPEPAPLPPDDIPDTSDWLTVVSKVRRDTMQWVTTNTTPQQKLLILEPSPGTGKTMTMIEAALHAQTTRRRVIFAARTKDMLEGELRTRIERVNRHVRLHVITGRDEKNCPYFANVAAVQAHGYAPGRTVCFQCPLFPRNAAFFRRQPCDYFATRMRAQMDSLMARRGLNDFPLILTTHAALVSSVDGDGGLYGKFWEADLVCIDEDPTEAFESAVALDQHHIEFESDEDQFAMIASLAGVMRDAVAKAVEERKASSSSGFKVQDPLSTTRSVRDPIHSKHGSVYAGTDLHQLLARVVGNRHRAITILRDAADTPLQPAAGEFMGDSTTDALNEKFPHRGLKTFADTCFTEMSLARQLAMHVFRQVRGKDISEELQQLEQQRRAMYMSADDVLNQHVDVHTSYRCRLDIDPDGTPHFVIHNFVSMSKATANVIVGDAYAHEDHYRQLFERPRPPAGCTDPVTLISHVAHFPRGSMVWRFRALASVSHLKEGGWYEHTTMVAEVLRQLRGQRVLIYGHKALRERFGEFMQNNGHFGLKEWAYEHWWGGRGKDEYKDFDAVVTISEPVQNINGMLNICNARAFRDAERGLISGAPTVMTDLQRVTFDAQRKHSLAHAMRNPAMHWRIRQEHQRQNVNEQAQAMHRVRGLMHPKTMVVFGNEVELTTDTLAASSTVSLLKDDRGKLVDATPTAFLTTEEVVAAIEAVISRLGCWTNLFSHSLLAHGIGLGVSGADPRAIMSNDDDDSSVTMVDGVVKRDGGSGVSSQLGSRRLLEIDLYSHRDPRWPDGNPNVVMDTYPSVIERVWTPPPRWEQLTRYAVRIWQIREAHKLLAERAPFQGHLTPSWAAGNKNHGGYRAVAWYGYHSFETGFEAARAILSDQYGPTDDDDKVHAPRRQPLIPF